MHRPLQFANQPGELSTSNLSLSHTASCPIPITALPLDVSHVISHCSQQTLLLTSFLRPPLSPPPLSPIFEEKKRRGKRRGKIGKNHGNILSLLNAYLQQRLMTRSTCTRCRLRTFRCISMGEPRDPHSIARRWCCGEEGEPLP